MKYGSAGKASLKVRCESPGLYSVSTSPGPGGGAAGVRLSCDRHLLAAAHKNIGVGPVLATLKAILSTYLQVTPGYSHSSASALPTLTRYQVF